MIKKRFPILMAVGLAGLALAGASASAAGNAQANSARVEVRLAPKTPGDGESMRWSPKGEKLALTGAGAGWETVLRLGPKEAPPFRIRLDRSPGAAYFDTLILDRNGDGVLTDEIPLRIQPSETRGKFWSSFTTSLEIPVAGPDGKPVRNAYPLSLWYVEDPQAEVQERVLRYSRNGWMEGSLEVEGGETFVLLTELKMDGVFDREDSWALAAASDRKSIFSDSRSCGEHAWLGEKAWRLVEVHPSGRKVVLEPFDPGLTRAEEKARADTLAADRNAPRSGKTVAFRHDFEAAEKEAQARGTALFVDFETTWCGPCKSMDEWVYTADEVVAAAAKVVAVKVDGDVRKDLVKRFKVAAYPTLVLAGPDGRVLKTYVGYSGVKDTAAFLRADEARISEAVAPGIERIEIKRGSVGAETAGDRWTINALLLDPAKARLGLGIAMDEIVGAETTSSIAARHGAIAAVNGGYFRTSGLLKGEPAGLMAVNGKILSEPAKGRASLAIANGKGGTSIAVAHVQIKAALIADGASVSSFAVDGFNRDRGPDDLVVFTPEFHRTTLTDPSGAEAIVREGRVVEIRDKAGSSLIPTDGMVLSGRGEAADWIRANLSRGAGVRLETPIQADPPLPFSPDFLIGGGPRLLRGGKLVPSEAGAFPAGFYGTRHPRTAAGVRADGTIVLAVVDGRQPKVGVGMTIDELAALMSELGCVDAVNLDGGGSTTMTVKGKVVNSPSDPTGERAVSDALLVFVR